MKTFLSVLLFVPVLSIAQMPGGNAAKGEMPDFSQLFMQQFDENKDGQVTLAEFRKPNDQQFLAIDTNRDGIVNNTEIQSYVNQMMQRMQDMQQKMRQQQAPQSR